MTTTQPNTDLAEHEHAAGTIEATTPREAVVAALVAWEGYRAAVRATDDYIRDQLLAWCEANGRIDMGDGTHYIAAVPSDRPCDDIPAAVKAILEVSDVETLAACVASDGIKHGAASKVLPADVFDRLFPKRTKPTLRKGGKALVKVDPQFVGGR